MIIVTPKPKGLVRMVIVSESTGYLILIQEQRWAMIVSQDNIIDKIVIFDDYWSGARYTEHYIQSIDNDGFNSIVIGKCYSKDGISIGLYSCEVG